MQWQGKKVLVLGCGRSGQAAVKFLLARGAHVVVNDQQEPREEVKAPFANAHVSWFCGHHDPKQVLSSDLSALVLSPGIDPRMPLVEEARRRSLPLLNELELAFQEITAPVIAITGTNGKSTTTMLIGHLLQAAGKKVCVAGNIGVPVLDVLSEAQQSEYVVVEVSSFQLEQTPSLKPHVAIWLNATEDHLDRYENFAAYVDAKANICRQLASQGVLIYNADDHVVVAALKKLSLSQQELGFSVQQRTGVAAWSEGESIALSFHNNIHKFLLAGLPLEGVHNQQNMMASLLAVFSCGVSDQQKLLQGLKTFQNLRHRLELVAEKFGVRYYDDSKGTNVGATIGALAGFQQPVVLIAGGKDKGGSYAPLVDAARKNVKCVILLGEATPLLEKAFAGKIPTLKARSLLEAVELATAQAEKNDVVLLSPACSSFDMFQNYAERGELFRKAVEGL